MQVQIAQLENSVSITDYVIDILLILVIFRQVRPHELTLRTVVLPLVLLAVAGIVYLRPFTVRGNDLPLIVILTAAGIVLGGLSGLADSIWRDGRRLMFRAGAVSVITWVAGHGIPVRVRVLRLPRRRRFGRQLLGPS